MIRLALVEWAAQDWRIFRQEQWMAEVRRNPSASGFPRIHFDVPESGYRDLVATWAREGHGSGRDRAIERLAGAGAVEIAPQ